MSEFSLASIATKKKTDNLSSLLLSDFILFCSFIFSYPLYFSYFIFFSPYLFKIFSFLSPLFVTTTLMLLAFFTLTPRFVNRDGNGLEYSTESKVSFLLTTYQTLVETLRSKVDDESDGCFGCLEDFEVYKIVFDTSNDHISLEIRQDSEEHVFEMEAKLEGCCLQQTVETPVEKVLDEKSARITPPETNQVKSVVKIFEHFLQEKDGVENLSSKNREKEVNSSLSVETDKADDEQKEEKEEFMRSGSEAILGNKISDPNVTVHDNVMVSSQTSGPNASAHDNYSSSRGIHAPMYQKKDTYYETMGSPSLGNFGSMRKEKEWKRTLACKLFEERHNNVDGGEGMDSLWETYETDQISNKAKLKSSSKKGKKGGNQYYDDVHDIDEYEYEDDSDGQLCCLQALKFSAGKMNLGMGRPNLVKFSKALKGFGWLHHVSSRNGKKVYH